MKVLVTGGAGYIGAHTAKRLREAGHEPVVLDDLRTGFAENVRWGPLVQASLDDPAAVRRAISDHAIDAVCHFAASAYVGDSMRDPGGYFRNNVANTLSLLEAVRDAGIGTFVFSSSCATYGHPERVPIDESMPQRPVNPYGESKLMVERMLDWFGRIHGLRWIALRYFNAAGAEPGSGLVERHDPETHLIPLAIEAAFGGAQLRILGSDYPTPDGTAVRDYIHVSDLADAHLAALAALEGGAASGGLNLGTGRGYSVREVVDAVARTSGRPVPYLMVDRRAGDPPTLVADAARAGAVLGWTPRYRGIDEIVETAIGACGRVGETR